MGMAFAPHESKFDKPSNAPAAREKGTEGHQSGDNEDQRGKDLSHMDIHEVVGQHGPAHKLEIEHSESSHTVTSHHNGGTHRSEHADAVTAHEHGKMAAGVGQGNEGQKQPASHEQGQVAEPMKGNIPGYK